ncbi:MAG: endonuclease/exonuclease/phosphatase family protein [bacterium]|nr:endonuclease/exonuclease/phosphatase family protein [bacterium]
MKGQSVILSFIISAVLFFACSRSCEDIKIMTFNIRYGTADDGEDSWNFRKDFLIETLKKFPPDILGTQESLDFQIEEIKDAFPQWQAIGVGRYHGIELPDRPHESMSGESCRVLFDSTKFSLIEEGTFWHSDTPDVPGSMTWGNTLPRVTTWGILQTKNTRQKFAVMNTHYHWDEPYVSHASRLIIQKQNELAVNLPTILMGDFNLSPNSESHEFFCGKKNWDAVTGRFSDAWITAGKSEQDAGTYHGFKGDQSGDRIDWILVTPELQVKKIQIIHDNQGGRFPSDHFPVVATLRLK